MVRTNLTIGTDRMEWLKEEALKRRLSGASDLLRRLIDAERERVEKEERPETERPS